MSAPTPSEAPSFQARMDEWLLACFGEKIARDKAERNHRFLEESLELVQALGCTPSEAHQLVDYTFGRPSGEAFQEVGGVVTTLAALCLAHGFDMQQAAEAELARIWTKVETIRAKQAAKPKHSPLPAAAPTPSEAVRVAVQECKRLASLYGDARVRRHASMNPSLFSGAMRTEREQASIDATVALWAAIDALAALSLHVGDVLDVQSDALGATPAGSGSALQPPAGASTPIPGANTDWVVTAPDGRQWHGESPLRVCVAAQRDTIDPVVTMQRINAIVDEENSIRDTELEAAREEGRQQVRAQPRSLLREPVKNISEISKNIPGGCYCPPDRCGAPVIMGRQTACLRKQHDAAAAQAIVTREGQDPQGLGGEAIERGPEGMRPEESRAQPSLHIEPAPGHRWIQATMEEWDEVQRIRDAATTPTEGPAQTLTPEALYEIVPPSAAEYMNQPPAVMFSVEWQTGWNACRNQVIDKVRASTLTDPEGAS